MKHIILAGSLLCLIGCGEMKDKLGIDEGGPSIPAEGTVLTESCDEYTLTQSIADGLGGETEVVTERSPQCGWNPPPRGELLESSCSEDVIGTKIFTYADGEYGTYTEEDTKSIECGYVPIVLEATIEGTGARFRDVTITVTSTENDEPASFEWEHTIGVATQEGNVIKIRGDGRTGEGYITLSNGELTEEYQYGIYNDEYCELGTDIVNRSVIDCMGYEVKATWNRGQRYRPAGVSWETGGMIYYGEPDVDTQRVVWEVVWINAGWSGESYGEELSNGDQQRAVSQIRYMQEYLDEAGVHVELKLVASLYGAVDVNATGSWLSMNYPELYNKTDIIVGWGSSEPGTCGVAYAGLYIGNRPKVAISRCGPAITLHEIGHAVGMAHGPENSGYPASGYIFPQFGHGWMDYCGSTGTIMSYDPSVYGLSTSLRTCPGNDSQLAGARDVTDEAYHLNRVRYNVSLIHDENLADELKVERAPQLLAAPATFEEIQGDEDEQILIMD